MALETDIGNWVKSAERQVRRNGKGKCALLRCRFDVPPKRIWAACTDRDRLRRWFADVSGDMREGATLTFDIGADCKVTSQILRCEPSHSLLLTWSFPGREIDEVELRLTADNNGALAELEHRSDDQSEWWFGAGAGWEYALIRLNALLRGDDPSSISADELDQILGPLWAAAGRVEKGDRSI
jgi:uncharacterized protein YndB with AHSA1/START domain